MFAVRFLPAIALVVFLVAAQSPPVRKQPSAPVKKAPAKTAPRSVSSDQQVQEWMRSLPLADKIAQLIIVPFYGENPNSRSRLYRKLATEVQTLHVGGMILVNRTQNGIVQTAEPTTAAAFLNRMQKLSRIPLIVGGDFERGSSMRVNGPTKFPHSMAFAAARDLEDTRILGAATARESRAIGIHWVFAPVADVNNNPDNPIINIRAFSENPEQVSQFVKAYVEGARSDPQHKVLVTVKHFPGHGNTATDTHLGLAKVESALPELQSLEFVPFRAAIEAHVDSVMTAHLWVPAIEPAEIPATISGNILNGILRKDLNFRGIITTDAMDMYGLSRKFPPGEAAVRALEAGVDVLLMPPNPREAIRAVSNAVRSGRLSAKRIDESVSKVLQAKVNLGLNKNRLVDLESINDSLALDEDEALAQRVADRALTLVRNEGNAVPLARPDASCWFILSESRLSQQGRQMLKTLETRLPNAKRAVLDPELTRTAIDEAVSQVDGCESFVVAAFAGFRGNGALSDEFTSLIQQLLERGKPMILAGMGNPYLLRNFEKVPAFIAAFSTVPASETALVKALAGDIPLRGKLPVTIPGIAAFGSGIETTVRR